MASPTACSTGAGRPRTISGQTREFVTIGVQQSYYSDPLASLYDTSYVSYSGRRTAVALSPIAVTARFSPAVAFDTNARVEYDVNGNGMQSFSTGGSLNAARASANLTFSRTRPTPRHRTQQLSHRVHGRADARTARHRQLRPQLGRGPRLHRQPVRVHDLHGAVLRRQFEFQKFNYQPSTFGSPTLPADRRFNVSLGSPGSEASPISSAPSVAVSE